MRNAWFLLLLAASALSAQDLPQKYAPLGQLIITRFKSAPFPHPLRADGHWYHTNFFSAADHYSDSRVALFIPKGFRADGKTDFVVHFHGWGNCITNALPKYKLIEQFAASRRNAILIVPQGPFNASDSFGGKLEDPDGFKHFMDETVTRLQQRGIIRSGDIGRIILSGHSGGYEVISSILAWGGLNDNIREVWLFDALYGNTERFVVWFDHNSSRFIDLYTDHGGTKDETEHLMTALQNNGVLVFKSENRDLTPNDLRHHLVFVHTSLEHDEVMQATDNFRRFLETSSLPEIRH